MTNARRIERLTREALGPGRRPSHNKLDDSVLRAVGIVILVVTVIAFASWPRGGEETRRAAKSGRVGHASIIPVTVRETATVLRTAEHTPIY
jgi:hypothetical protein